MSACRLCEGTGCRLCNALEERDQARKEIAKLRGQIAEAWSILTGWDAGRIADGSHEASADPGKALIEAAMPHKRHAR